MHIPSTQYRKAETFGEMDAYPVEDNLRSHVLRGSTERPRLATSTNVLGETKVHLTKNNEKEFQCLPRREANRPSGASYR